MRRFLRAIRSVFINPVTIVAWQVLPQVCCAVLLLMVCLSGQKKDAKRTEQLTEENKEDNIMDTIKAVESFVDQEKSKWTSLCAETEVWEDVDGKFRIDDYAELRKFSLAVLCTDGYGNPVPHPDEARYDRRHQVWEYRQRLRDAHKE